MGTIRLEFREALLGVIYPWIPNTGRDRGQRGEVGYNGRASAEEFSIAVYYFRSQQYDLGDARCWVDDNEKGAIRLAGYWTKQYNMAVWVALLWQIDLH